MAKSSAYTQIDVKDLRCAEIEGSPIIKMIMPTDSTDPMSVVVTKTGVEYQFDRRKAVLFGEISGVGEVQLVALAKAVSTWFDLERQTQSTQTA